jgi:hypothetical protein
MSDRRSANKCALNTLQKAWNKALNLLFCHLHPLDTLASDAKSALKKTETTKSTVFGSDCVAANVVLAVSINGTIRQLM